MQEQKTDSQIVDLPVYHDDLDETQDRSFARSRGPWWRQRRWIIGIAVVLLVVIVAGVLFNVFNKSRLTTTTASYQFSQVTQGNLLLSATATGTLQGNTYNVDFPVSGIIAEVDVQLGQQVQVGQVLAKLDIGTILKAPRVGVVVAINGSVGTATDTIANTGQSAFQIADSLPTEALININEADMGHLAPGEAITFSVDAYTNRTFRGTVRTILPAAATVNSVVTYPVLVNLDTTSFQGANLLPGMTINATVRTLSHAGVLLVPVSAVSSAQKAISQGLITRQQSRSALIAANKMLTTYLQSNGATALQDAPHATFVLEQVNNQWVLKPVVLGETDGTFYEALAGLTTNDTVLSGGVGGSTAPTSGGSGRFFLGGGGGRG